MSDLTLIYYTANRISADFAGAVRRSLVSSMSLPIIVVSQNGTPHSDTEISADFTNQMQTLIYVAAAPSIWQVYQNVLTAARLAATPFIACCEDDTLYAPSHFTYRPAPDVFAYDRSRWVITRQLSEDKRRREAFYYWRARTQMAMCIAPRQLMIDTLEERFAHYPAPVPHDVAKKTGWGEPGRYEKNLKLTPRRLEYFNAEEPSVTFNHSESLMGRRRVNPDDIIKTELPNWGHADALWTRIHG